MVNEINVVGVGSAQGLAYASSATPNQVKPAVERTVQAQAGEQEVRVQAGKSVFPALASQKDDAVQVAKSVRDADKAIARVDNLLNEMRQKVQVVKNYPPFPPGNQERVDFINSIEGLRKQLEAMSVPPVDRDYAPVFYPKESDLPSLDATSGDAQVQAFGQAVEVVQQRVNAGYAELRAQADRLSSRMGTDLPQPPSEDQVAEAGASIAGKLATLAQPLLNNSNLLAQLGG